MNLNLFLRNKEKVIFIIIFVLFIIDIVINITKFGFVYTDIDQIVMWNAAVDYSKFIFHEPFFYGQNYNYMLESLVSIPLIWIGIPPYKALPLVTNLISVFPFIFLAFYFLKRNKYFWSYLSLLFPLLLTYEYNLLAGLSRGFVQAHIFVPFLIIPLLNPEKKKSLNIFYPIAALSFIANQSSFLFIFPVFVYLASFHFKYKYFYTKAIMVLPFVIIDLAARYYYIINPEKVLLSFEGIIPDIFFYILNFKKLFLIKEVSFINPNFGFLYLIFFFILFLFSVINKNYKVTIFIVSSVAIFIFSQSLPKVYITKYDIFLSPNRFYLLLPFIFLINIYLLFYKEKINKSFKYLILVFAIIAFSYKYTQRNKFGNQLISKSNFYVIENKRLFKRVSELKELSIKYDVDLIVNKYEEVNLIGFDNYAFYPMSYKDELGTKAVSLKNDRRTWLYCDALNAKNIILNGFEINNNKLKGYDYYIIGEDKILIKLEALNVKALMQELEYNYGIDY